MSRPAGEWRRFGRFAAVGASGAVLDFALLNLLHGGLRWPLAAANVVSVSCAIANNFYWNRRWTFVGASSARPTPQFLRFAAVSLVGLLLNTAILVALTQALAERLPRPWDYNGAKAVAVLVVLGWNYLANRAWTFRR